MLWLQGRRKNTNEEDERNPKKRRQDPKTCHLSGLNAVLNRTMMIDGVGWMEGKRREFSGRVCLRNHDLFLNGIVSKLRSLQLLLLLLLHQAIQFSMT
jgi:hypothetical protein